MSRPALVSKLLYTSLSLAGKLLYPKLPPIMFFTHFRLSKHSFQHKQHKTNIESVISFRKFFLFQNLLVCASITSINIQHLFYNFVIISSNNKLMKIINNMLFTTCLFCFRFTLCVNMLYTCYIVRLILLCVCFWFGFIWLRFMCVKKLNDGLEKVLTFQNKNREKTRIL